MKKKRGNNILNNCYFFINHISTKSHLYCVKHIKNSIIRAILSKILEEVFKKQVKQIRTSDL